MNGSVGSQTKCLFLLGEALKALPPKLSIIKISFHPMALREFLARFCVILYLENSLRVTSVAHPVVNYRAGPILEKSVLGQLYWVYIFLYCPVEDSGMVAPRIH